MAVWSGKERNCWGSDATDKNRFETVGEKMRTKKMPKRGPGKEENLLESSNKGGGVMKKTTRNTPQALEREERVCRKGKPLVCFSKKEKKNEIGAKTTKRLVCKR